MFALSPTPRQLRVLSFIHGYQQAHGGVSPTLSEISDALGLKGKAGVHEALCGLEERGRIRRLRNRTRAIEVLAPPTIPRAPDGAPLFFVPILQEEANASA